jgi:hypothetical protein
MDRAQVRRASWEAPWERTWDLRRLDLPEGATSYVKTAGVSAGSRAGNLLPADAACVTNLRVRPNSRKYCAEC